MEPKAWPLAACIGIDWADAHHDIALQVPGVPETEEQQLPHTPEALQAWLSSLAQRFPGQWVGVALETSRGPLVQALLEAPFVVLYPVNPRSLRRFRETFAPAGAKDDVPDARLLLELLVKHRDRLRAWAPDDVETRRLERLVEDRRTAVELRIQLTLQLQARLKEYFPQALEWAGADLASPMACTFLQRWPTLAVLQRAKPATIRQFYTRHRSRQRTRMEACLAAIATAVPLTTDRAVIDSNVLAVRLLTSQLQALAPSLAAVERAIADTFEAHPDAFIFASFPGAGPALAPRLLAAFGTNRTRYASAAAVQTAVGIAPVTKRSGKTTTIEWRWATSAFVRQTFHEFALHSLRSTAWARAYYAQQRARGHSHHAAVRSLAFKWIRILWRCWQDRTTYDDARYMTALQIRRSPLSKHLTKPEPIADVA